MEQIEKTFQAAVSELIESFDKEFLDNSDQTAVQLFLKTTQFIQNHTHNFKKYENKAYFIGEIARRKTNPWFSPDILNVFIELAVTIPFPSDHIGWGISTERGGFINPSAADDLQKVLELKNVDAIRNFIGDFGLPPYLIKWCKEPLFNQAIEQYFQTPSNSAQEDVEARSPQVNLNTQNGCIKQSLSQEINAAFQSISTVGQMTDTLCQLLANNNVEKNPANFNNDKSILLAVDTLLNTYELDKTAFSPSGLKYLDEHHMLFREMRMNALQVSAGIKSIQPESNVLKTKKI